MGSRESTPKKRHLDRFGRFCTSHGLDQQTDKTLRRCCVQGQPRIYPHALRACDADRNAGRPVPVAPPYSDVGGACALSNMHAVIHRRAVARGELLRGQPDDVVRRRTDDAGHWSIRVQQSVSRRQPAGARRRPAGAGPVSSKRHGARGIRKGPSDQLYALTSHALLSKVLSAVNVGRQRWPTLAKDTMPNPPYGAPGSTENARNTADI